MRKYVIVAANFRHYKHFCRDKRINPKKHIYINNYDEDLAYRKLAGLQLENKDIIEAVVANPDIWAILQSRIFPKRKRRRKKMEAKQTRKDTIEIKFKRPVLGGDDRICRVTATVDDGEWDQLEVKDGQNRVIVVREDPDSFAQDLAQALDELRDRVGELDS